MPLVTVLITTRNRPEELRRTLIELRRQDYSDLELIVIDDGSHTEVKTVVREEWPGAVFVREEVSAGSPQRRSEGFARARGKYILEIDDDSHPVESNAIRRAVEVMERMPHIGALAFHVFNGQTVPANLGRPPAKYVSSFVGCGVLFRRSAILQTGGFCPFFQSHWEESELGLRFLKEGWSIYFWPEPLIHHRVSPLNRKHPVAWMRSFRNKLWSQVMHYPLDRLVIEGSWVVGVAVWDSIRLLRPHYLVCGLFELASGLPRAFRMREPMSRKALGLYDALRFRGVYTKSQLQGPPKIGIGDLAKWFGTWWRRPRQRAVWDRRAGDVGHSEMVGFAHEYQGGSTNPRGTRS
jgi:GT2 family glycosyltransferase